MGQGCPSHPRHGRFTWPLPFCGALLLTERGACVTLPPVNENELRQVRMAVQWCALLLLVLTVMVGLVVFGVVTVDVGVAPG